MNADKTIEEIRKTVLAYCEEVCPNIGDYWKCELHDISVTCRNSKSTIPHLIWHANVLGSSYLVSPKGYCDKYLWPFLYRALGLAELDRRTADIRNVNGFPAFGDYRQIIYAKNDPNAREAMVNIPIDEFIERLKWLQIKGGKS